VAFLVAASYVTPAESFLVVEPFFLKSLKVLPVMEEALIFSEKVALREAVGATPLALALGEVLRTLERVAM
jgi:hypothetical protein